MTEVMVKENKSVKKKLLWSSLNNCLNIIRYPFEDHGSRNISQTIIIKKACNFKGAVSTFRLGFFVFNWIVFFCLLRLSAADSSRQFRSGGVY